MSEQEVKNLKPVPPEDMEPTKMEVDDLEKVKARAAEQQEPAQPPQTQLVRLDPLTMTRVELVATKLQLVSAERRNLQVLLKDLDAREAELKREETALMNQVMQNLGVQGNKTLRLVDRQKGLCKLLDG